MENNDDDDHTELTKENPMASKDQPNGGDFGLSNEPLLYLAPQTNIDNSVTEQYPMLASGGTLNAIKDCWIWHRIDLTTRMMPILRLLQVFGYFPCVTCEKNVDRTRLVNSPLKKINSKFNAKSGGKRLLDWLCQIYSLALIGLNLYIFQLNVSVTRDYKQHFSMLHAFTITSLITGLKPMINAANIFLFNICKTRHKKLLTLLDRVEKEFAIGFGLEPNVYRYNVAIILASIVVGIFFFGVRVTEFVVQNDTLGRSFLVDISLLLVPLISVWGTIPLFYFAVVELLVLYWCKHFRDKLVPPDGNREKPLKYYYKKFLELTELQEAAGDLFGPWLLVSMGWSVFTLCLTIYFATQAQTFLQLPDIVIQTTTNAEELYAAQLILYFNVVWSCLQIFIAWIYICIICYLGTTVNEESRLIMKAVLEGINDSEMESERFLVTCFMYKMQTQYVWGVTVWRAFPVERSVFFTMVSLIVTYAVLLMKFRDDIASPNNAHPLNSNLTTDNITNPWNGVNRTVTDLANAFMNYTIY